MKLSLMVPTFNNAETIERTLRAVLAQAYRPLEVLVYDEASQDNTRAIVRKLLTGCSPDIEVRLLTSEVNSGPVEAWRIALHEIVGEWCAFVWSDDVLAPDYSERMMAGVERARIANRKLVACSAVVERDGEARPYYSEETGIVTAVEFSEGMFLRRFPLTQICAVTETEVARTVFDRHIQFDNPRRFDYNRFPYGNDVGYLSELAAAGNGVELLGSPLVTLVDSTMSMTRRGGRDHLWQMRWQYTFNQYRVWKLWASRGVPQAIRVADMAERRLALCSLMMGGQGVRANPKVYLDAVRAYRDFRRFDYQINGHSLDAHRHKTHSSPPESSATTASPGSSTHVTP